MKTNQSALFLAIALCMAGTACAHTVPATAATPATPATPAMAAVTPPATTQASSPMTELTVRDLLIADGFTEINDVKFVEGVWTADAKSADGNHVEVKIDATTGKIMADDQIAKMSKDQIIANVQAAGYTNVHDVDFEGGVWKAEANDSEGNDVELKLDPDTGKILGSEKDVIGQKHTK